MAALGGVTVDGDSASGDFCLCSHRRNSETTLVLICDKTITAFISVAIVRIAQRAL